MPTYNFIHPKTKAKISVTGDSPPDEATLDQIFSETAGQSAAPKQSYEDFKTEFIKSQATDDYKIKSANADAFSGMKNMARKALPYARPTLEGLGAIVGGGLGGGGGLLAGAPTVVGAPAAAVTGGLAGAGLGYSTVKTGLDYLEEKLGGSPEAERLANRSMAERMLAPVHDAAMGTTYEMGGQVLAPFVGKAIRAAKATPKAIWSPVETVSSAVNSAAKRSALKRIQAATTKEGPIAARSAANKAEYEALQNDIQGFNLTPAQITDDAATLKMQQYLQMQAEGAPVKFEGQTMNNRAAVSGYLNQNMPQGSLDDFLAAIEAQGAARTNNVSTQASQMAAMDKEAASAQMRQLELEAQKRLKGQAGALYDAVDLNMPVAPNMNFGQWKAARSEALNELRAANARAASGDASGIMPAKQKVAQLEETLRNAGKPQADEFGAMVNQFADPAEVAKLRKANDFYRDTYVPAVRQGQTAKNLATTRTGEFRVADEISAGKYLQEGDSGLAAANDFNRLFGQNPNAKKALQGYAQRDLFDAVTANGTQAPSLKAAEAWIAKRTPALKKLGMENEFSGFMDALKQEADLADFKAVLGQDPQTVLKSLLAARGDKDIVRSALDLKTIVQGNTGALNGLKRSISDLMMADTQIVKQVGGNPVVSDAKMKAFWQKYEPAMKLIYSPEEMKAMTNVRKAFEMENRMGRSLTGVDGSQTATNSAKEKALEKLSPVLSWTGRAARWAINAVATNKAEAVEQFVLKAQYDPVFAKELETLGDVGRKQGEKAMKLAVDKWLGRYTAYTTASEISKSYRPNSETDTQY